jgi:hypothetical protein
MLFRFLRLTTRINALEDEQARLRRAVEALDLEWSDTYDKVRSVLAKLSKRDERARQDPPGSTNSPALVPDDLSAQIRASRHAGGRTS